MTRTRTGLFAVLVTVVLLGPLSAQEPPALAAGAHVRITAPSLGWNQKTRNLAGVHGDTLLVERFLSLFLGPKPVPLSAVTALEVSTNRGSRDGAAWIGGLVGAVAGGFAAYAHGGPCDPGSFCKMERTLGTVFGASLGGLAGVLIGYAVVPERWAPVGLPTPRIAPLPGGALGLGASLAF